ncbi:hypothetical protein [Streptomyces bicolor]|uniref:hypothetical protein n=1 Tax=Streptomyces bicolor TaxID=66874 RepID=UPI0004E0CF91|nr:hypothetical protein [Streptomyces bicolor]
MGIRTLNRRTTPAPANATTAGDAPSTAPAAPPFAAGAGTARIPTDPMRTLRHTAAALWHRLPHRAQDWAELTRSYLALARTLLPRPRPVRIVTVFVATAGTLTEPQAGSAPDRPRPHPHPNPHPNHRGPGPDATP